MSRSITLRTMVVLAFVLGAVIPLHLSGSAQASVSPPPLAASPAIIRTYSNLAPVVIPDSTQDLCTVSAPGTPAVSTIVVPDSATIVDVNVGLNIAHTWVGDVTVQLTSPAGTSALLVNRPGWPTYTNPITNTACYGFDGDNIVTTLDDESAGGLVDNANPPIGASYTPTQALSAFDGENSAGTWTLQVWDNASAEPGTLNSWSLVIDDNIAANAAPVAVNDPGYATNEDTVLNVPALTGVLANDTDADGDTLTAVLVTGPASGSLTLNADGSFTYTPAANASGVVTFTYNANDGALSSATPATVTITVNPVNDAPVAVNDPAYVTNEDTALNVLAPTGVLANDTDAEGNTLTAALVAGPASGSLTFNADGSFTYTPAANASGVVTFTYNANDGTVNSATPATVTITVNAVNDAPVAVNDPAYVTNEDTVLNVLAPTGVLANDTDAEGNTLTAALVAGPASGSLTFNPDGSFTYTPAANASGVVTFTYNANDGALSSATPATVTITVNPVNDAPVAVNDPIYATNEDTALNVLVPTGVLANDTDAEGNTLTAVLVTGPASGSLTFNADGSFLYTPAANASGVITFTYNANDGTVNSAAPATVTITVNPVNDAPVAVNDPAYVTNEDTVLNVLAPTGVLANDTDAEGNTLTAALVAGPASGSLTFNADGSFTYTPAANASGVVTFTYNANDGTVNSAAPATVTITVNPVNDAPVAVNDPAYATNEDTVLNVLAPTGVLANDTDAEGNTLTAALVAGPVHGLFTLYSNGSFDYTPDPDYAGPDSFTYHANDGTVDSNIATVTITVAAVNDAPVAVNDPTYSTNEDTALNVPALTGVLANDTDADGDTLTAALVTGPASGSLTLNANGSFLYMPAANASGVVTFTYNANDGTVNSAAPATVTITVNAVNDPPVAVNDPGYNTPEDTALNVPALTGVLANDTDAEGNTLTAALDVGPANGTLTLSSDGSFLYTPTGGYSGPDSFTYHANDGAVDSNIATVNIAVGAVNDVPVAVDDPGYATNEDTALTIPALTGVLANDTDADGDTLTAALDVEPANGTLIVNSDGSFAYTPDPDYAGPDSFTYHANDGTVDSNIATVTITVAPVNDVPVAVDDAYTIEQDTPLSVPTPGVLANDIDADGDPLIAINGVPANGVLAFNVDGSFTYIPNAGFIGDDTFTYQADDGTANSNVATVTITVEAVAPINAAPVAVDDATTTNQDTELNVAAPGVLANDTDADGDPLTAVRGDDPLHGGLILNADGSFTYFPDPGFVGADTFTYQAFDGVDYSPLATVTIEVLPVVVPVGALQAFDDALATGPVTPIAFTSADLLANDSIPVGADVSIASLGTPLFGTVTKVGDLITYTPLAGFTGEDRFGYTVQLGSGETSDALVWVTVWKPVPACRDIGGEPNSIVYALVPGTAVPTSADVFCRVVVENRVFVRPAGEIGVRDLIDLGIIQAVDVFSLDTNGGWYTVFNTEVDVCLAGSGHLYFLSATGQPRAISAPPTWTSGGYTCGTISSAGTVILVP